METGLRVPPRQGGEGKRRNRGRIWDGCEVGEPHWQSGAGRTLLPEPGRGQGLPQGFGAVGRSGHRLLCSAGLCLGASSWRETLPSAGSCCSFLFLNKVESE